MSKPLLTEFNSSSELPEDLPEEILFILDRFEKNHKRSYLVGGSVRDLLLGKAISDYDITTPATPEEVKKIFSDFIVLDTGLQHGTVTLLIDNKPFEITTFRTDGKYSDHRRPNNVELTTSLYEDSQRRDFTINQLAYNPTEGLVDYHNGLADLKAKLVRAVGDPYKRFNEDALRIIRALRFGAQLNFNVEENTFAAVKDMINDLDFVAAERLTHELSKILNSDFLSDNWQNLMVLWNYLFPHYACEIYRSLNVDFLENLPKNHNINLTILTYFLTNEDLSHFLDKIKLKRLDSGLIKSYVSALHEVAESHGVEGIEAIGGIGKIGGQEMDFETKSKMNIEERNFFSPLDLVHLKNKYKLDLPTFIEVLDLIALEPKYGISPHTIEEIKASFSEILEKQLPLSTLELAITGKDLINLGFSQSKAVGNVLDVLLHKTIQGELENKEESLLSAAKAMLS